MDRCSKMKTMLMVFVFGVLGFMIPSYAGVQYSLAECQQKAQAGDAEAQWQLACRYRDGRDVARNMRKAVSHCRMAAEKGHKQACLYLSELYSKGRYVKKDLEQSTMWREKAEAIQEDEDKTNDEDETSKKSSGADSRLNNDLEKSSNEDIIEVALDYLYGRQLHEKNVKLGTSLLYGEAKDGNKSAQRVFVQVLAKGGLNLDDESIRFELVNTWIENAAHDGLAAAFRLKGNIASANDKYADAIRFWKTAWRKGDMQALRSLAFIHDRFDPEDEQAVKKLAAWHSDGEAIFFYEKALEYYENEMLLMFRLALLKFTTEDSKIQNREEAEKLLKKCYDQEPNNSAIADVYGRVAHANAQVDLVRCNEYYEKKYDQAPGHERYYIRKQWRQSVEKIQLRIDSAKRLIKER